MRSIHQGFVLAVACCTLLAAAASADPLLVRVDESSLGTSWNFTAIGNPATVGPLVEGPGTPPHGIGSASFALAAPSDAQRLETAAHAGTLLKNLVTLTYWTRQSDPSYAIGFSFGVDYDQTDGVEANQGRLRWEPTLHFNVLADAWQSWNAMQGGAWWSDGDPVVGGTARAAACVRSNPCTWGQLLTVYPESALAAGAVGTVGLAAGPDAPAGWVGAADGLRFKDCFDTDVLYDFESNIPVELQSFSVD